MGKGSTGQASVKNGHDFIGIEIDPTYFGLAQKAIAAMPGVRCSA
jgi:DNA modification methylase